MFGNVSKMTNCEKCSSSRDGHWYSLLGVSDGTHDVTREHDGEMFLLLIPEVKVCMTPGVNTSGLTTGWERGGVAMQEVCCIARAG